MANYTTYGVKNEGIIGDSKTIVFENTKAEHQVEISANTVITTNSAAVTPTVFRRFIRIKMPSTVYSVTFPQSENIKWNRGFAPCMNVPDKDYLVELFTYNGGQDWEGSWMCLYEVL